MRNLGQSVKVATGKVEAVIAGAILVVVVVLFAKYYDRGTPPNPAPTTQASPTTAKRGIN